MELLVIRIRNGIWNLGTWSFQPGSTLPAMPWTRLCVMLSGILALSLSLVLAQEQDDKVEPPESATASQPAPPGAAQQFQLNLGYNAFQLGGTTDEQVRGRIYTNIGLSVRGLEVGFQGLNEASPSFGWNNFYVGHEKIPLRFIYTTRHSGKNLGNIVGLDHAFGTRLDISEVPFLDYGYVDFVKNIGRGSSGYSGYEVSTFVGKEFGNFVLESLFQYQGSFWQYWEVETLLPPFLKYRSVLLRPYVRVELPSTFDDPHFILIGGVQIQ